MSKLVNQKLFTLEEAQEKRLELKKQGKTLVLTNGCFDLLHAGHLFYLNKAAELGDCLWIALNGEKSVAALKGPTRPVQGNEERAYALASLECVAGIILFETPRLDHEIRILQPDVYAKAGDYSIDKLNPDERKALEEAGADIQFLPFLEGYSTTSLIEKISKAANTFCS